MKIGNAQGPIRFDVNKISDKIKLKGALLDFESFFISYMLKDFYKPLNTGNNNKNHIYEDFLREALSSQLAKSGGIGLADSLEKNFLK